MPLTGLSCTISAPGGAITLTSSPYRLEAETRREQGVTKRKSEATNPFVEGTYVVSSVRENVAEQVSVYVKAADDSATYNAVKRLTDALDQIVFTMTFAHGGMTETWTCFSADYTIGTQHEFQHAGLAVVRATVPRLPTVTKVP